MARRVRNGCCNALHLHEENSRFLLLAIVLIIYMFFGAILFHILESEAEEKARQKYWNCFENFKQKYKHLINESDLFELLYEFGNATASGLISQTQRWDIPGSFYFVATVVSTIGFGMTTPKTIYGRMFVIIYGFLGCSGGILFFNLFLERIITLLAYSMRRYHERQIRKDCERRDSLYKRRESSVSVDDKLDSNWKPSVYWVMSVLALFTAVIVITASSVYTVVEKWDYFDCIYFCFVAFSTIGFGDLVSSEKKTYNSSQTYSQIYRLLNFIFIALGCCCIYSLFNVTSIIIKQFLNFLIKKLNFKCKCFRSHRSPVLTQVTRSRRNALTPTHLKNYANTNHQKTVTVKASIADSSDADSTYDSDNERRNSNEMICMKDILKTNKVSLAILQKELYESAQKARNYRSPAILLPPKVDTNDFNTGAVGPLAIVSQKLGEGED